MKSLLLYFACAISCLQAYTQNVGIGTTTPTEKFTVKADGKGISQESLNGTVKVGFYTASNDAYIQTHSNHPLNFSTNNGGAQMILATNGNFGIGVSSPAYLLDVAGRIRLRNQADGNSAGIWLNNPANTSTIGFVGIADATTMGFYGNPYGWGLAMNTNTGNVGIKTLAPANKLQIGSLGSVGFAGNDLAIGNGTNAMVVYQSNASTLLASTTDIVLMPRNNGAGRVGINTNSPRAPLDVTDYVTRPGSYYSYLNRDAWTLGVRDCQNCLPAISIFASNAIFAAEFDAFSDARIKDITGISNTAKDLQTISALQITDYTMKDKVKYGDKSYKKVIAQEVEKVYPQAVSKHTDFIPNVYQATNKIEKTASGYRLSFINKHNISSTAKKLRLLFDGSNSMEQFDILSIPSDYQVVIKIADLKTDKVFVYGEEVADFRTVDYEGLTTLNISATQELSKLVKQQQAKIDELVQEIKLLKEKAMPGLTVKN